MLRTLRRILHYPANRNERMKRYPYVGPHDILRHALKEPAGMPVRSAADLEDWLRRTGQKPNRLGQS